MLPYEDVSHYPKCATGLNVKCKMDLSGNNRLDPSLDPPTFVHPTDPASSLLNSLQRDSKMLFEPEVALKTEPKNVELTSDNLDKFIKKAKKLDPMLLWGVLRPKILRNLSLWDFLVDKILVLSQENQNPKHRLKLLLHELNELLVISAEVLEHCCESKVKIEKSDEENPTASVNDVENEIQVPEKLLSCFGLSVPKIKLKSDSDFSKYERLFALDESLKVEVDEEEDLKEDDLKNFNDVDELDLLDFALEHEEATEDEDEQDSIWKPASPTSRSKSTNDTSSGSSKQKSEKPRQCDKVRRMRTFPKLSTNSSNPH